MSVQVLAMQTAERVVVLTPLAARVQAEYREMPGLRLTVRQAARLFGIPADVAGAVLNELRRASILSGSDDGTYGLVAEPSRKWTAGPPATQPRGRVP